MVSARLQASPRAADGDASPASVAADHAEATSAVQGAGSPPVSVKVETPEILRLAGSVRTGAWEEDEREAAFS